ncbi:threonine/serine dehydratase [Roseobacter denitrificans]|uniref:Threonine dehydratase, putative n=1 Tax=Roseobacter denitrificans (strain ATCC 33942 / OCh 114) TaxID=375451 RepID=Q161F5_ROSDO|nr:threonine/serine dehydratase [Roseobacter denitrificans]ABG33388.1 threonine dehydratase, putative [Roseobacter denitrificans OCh 114]AVL52711.1 threonine/serine dehydratase [Roseobacter denitrificans]SFG23759.1 threonine dehydratase [Roseobacter denitrificans OCh 114]
MNIDAIRAAEQRLKGHVRRTPLLCSPNLDAIAGCRVFVKAECLQHTGSFKYRGALSAISALDADARKRGIIAFSSGNHAQGIALAARQFDAPAVIIMPQDAPSTKIENTRTLGAEIVLYDRVGGEDRDAIGAELSAKRNLTLIKPFDNAQVIAGQGTAGLEIAAQAQARGIDDADVIVCCGGGGFASGIALALEADAPGFRVRPAEPAGFDDMARSLKAGARLHNAQTSGSLCDAIITPTPGVLTFPILQRLAGPGLVVSDEEALHAMALAFAHLKVVAEPGGAVALASALFHTSEIDADTVIVTISGGNVDADVFQMALKRCGDSA